MHAQERGAFTGETSPQNAAPEGRHTSSSATPSAASTTARRTRGSPARSQARWPTACGRSRPIGERLDERRAGQTEAIIDRQLAEPAVSGLSPGSTAAGLVIAYEPVWAIGTGEAAAPADAQAVASQIRTILPRALRPRCGRRADPVRRQRDGRQRDRFLRPAGCRRGARRRRVPSSRSNSPPSCAAADASAG